MLSDPIFLWKLFLMTYVFLFFAFVCFTSVSISGTPVESSDGELMTRFASEDSLCAKKVVSASSLDEFASPASSPIVILPSKLLEFAMLLSEEETNRVRINALENLFLYSLFYPLSVTHSININSRESMCRDQILSEENLIFYSLVFAERYSEIKDQGIIVVVDDK